MLEQIHTRMSTIIEWHGGRIDDIRYCPHDYHEHCECRKPRAGMLLQLADLWRIDLARSYMVGDAWTDIAAGREANCRSIMVRTGRGAEQLQLPESRQYPADHVADDLADGVGWLLQEEEIMPPIYGDAAPRRYVASAAWSTALAMGG